MNTIKAIEAYLGALERAGWDISRYRVEKEEHVRASIDQEILNAGLVFILAEPFEQIIEYFSRIAGIDERSMNLSLDQQVLLPSWVPQSIHEAFELWNFLLTDPEFPRSLFPIMQDYLGSYLCVDVSDLEAEQGRVFVCLEGFIPWPKYKNISALFEIHTRCLERGIIYIEGGKYLEVKDEEMSKLIDECPDLAQNPPD
jgi:hypothetical protein